MPDGVYFESAAAFEAWLEQHGEAADGVWVRMAKKASGIPSVDLAGAVEVALCFGWIDSQSRGLDETWYLQRFTPRRPRSVWSKVNRERVEALAAAGRMRPAGLAEVERAKADGRWASAYDGMATATVPGDLAAALDEAGVRAAFDALDRQARYAVLHRVQTARTPAARARRIAAAVERLADGPAGRP